ncbi:hypothetical protein TUBRATIS_14550 [Tubulinosema ratisbonensis]|uniref:Uncharacterized protein n=1 Tax=Tubulinosema ratisbonensis TaxID=291195 RepID=A0A437ALU8_9MICR|nr:hypothetical protein TUBRATIS_14550 [Tubulinosema ratisbonensis]
MRKGIVYGLTILITMILLGTFIKMGGVKKVLSYVENAARKSVVGAVYQTAEFFERQKNKVVSGVKETILRKIDEKALRNYSDYYGIPIEELLLIPKEQLPKDGVFGFAARPDYDPNFSIRHNFKNCRELLDEIDKTIFEKGFDYTELAEVFHKKLLQNNLKNHTFMNYDMHQELSMRNEKIKKAFEGNKVVGMIFDANYLSTDTLIRDACLTAKCLNICTKFQKRSTARNNDAEMCLSLWKLNVENRKVMVLGNSYAYTTENGIFVEVVPLGLNCIEEFESVLDSEDSIIIYISQYYRELAKMLSSKGCETCFFPICMPCYDPAKISCAKIRLHSQERDALDILRMSLKGSILGLMDAMHNYPNINFIICNHETQ